MSETHDDGHFKLRLDEPVEERVIPAAVDELRIEKLSQRVTMISVLIPVLIVIVLVFTYVDIKRRVMRTEDTGTMEVQNLSKDLESRFSSLSLRQATLEESVTKLNAQSNQALAATQVKLKKMEEAFKQLEGAVASKKEISAATAELDKKLTNVAASIEESSAQIASFSQELEAQVGRLSQELAANQTLLTQFEAQLAQISQEKIDKPALDLALRLETLKIQQALKAELESLQTKLQALEKQIKHPAQAPATPPPAAPAPTQPTSPAPPASQKIEEQTIPR